MDECTPLRRGKQRFSEKFFRETGSARALFDHELIAGNLVRDIATGAPSQSNCHSFA